MAIPGVNIEALPPLNAIVGDAAWLTLLVTADVTTSPLGKVTDDGVAVVPDQAAVLTE
jgi:hypothetical protein